MAVVLIEGHEVHRHVGCISREVGLRQLLRPKAAVNQIAGVGNALGAGGSSTVPCVWREAPRSNRESSKFAVWSLTPLIGA